MDKQPKPNMETPIEPGKTRLRLFVDKLGQLVGRQTPENDKGSRLSQFANKLGSFVRARSFGRTRSVEHEVDPRLKLMAELQKRAAETEGTPGGVAFATLAELEKRHPGSVKLTTEIDPDGINDPRAVFFARLASIGGEEHGVARTDLYAKPFELPDQGGSASRIDLSVYLDDSSVRLYASRPQDISGRVFSGTYEWNPEVADPKSGEDMSQILAGIYRAASYEKLNGNE